MTVQLIETLFTPGQVVIFFLGRTLHAVTNIIELCRQSMPLVKSLGALAGLAGDKWSLGFVAETEHQVVEHLDEHLAQLPEQDIRSRAILEQMKQDESRHATVALEAGGSELPAPIKQAMKFTSKIMTSTAYKI